MHYRLYALNPNSGKIMQGSDLAAESDADAIAAGHSAHPSSPFEIWCRQRCVFTSMNRAGSAKG
ncbi:hypothetical protein [Sphingomonas abietis]|uniref:Uncharacterized protein n=1 Tax=Sphingomonas abietis TaxID=3012344 RepID=A0ABY7NPM7_9SPHN|nr:hypothetical protein [Sphingomonas abietis]WBO21884.1 hypothetical protein PBT88_17210 [Sphingomonas abietis]